MQFDLSTLENVDTGGELPAQLVLGHKTSFYKGADGTAHAILEVSPVKNTHILADFDGNVEAATQKLAGTLQQHIDPQLESISGITYKGMAKMPDGSIGLVHEVPSVNLNKVALSDTELGMLRFGGWGIAADADSAMAMKMLNEGKKRGFVEALEHSGQAMSGAGKPTLYGGFIKRLKANPEVAQSLEQKLATAGATEFSYKGHGRSGAFFQTNNGTVVGIRNHIPPRTPTPFHLQPVGQISEAGLHLEATPMLNTADVTRRHIQQLHEAVENYVGPAGERYKFIDPALRNVGLVGDTPYILDGDAIRTVSATERVLPAQQVDMSHWVEPSGQWKQYTSFEELHSKFDSPLHQSGGKLAASAESGIVASVAAAAPPPPAQAAPSPLPTEAVPPTLPAQAAPPPLRTEAVPPSLPAQAAPPPLPAAAEAAAAPALSAAESTASTMSKALGAESSAAKGLGSIEAGLSKVGGKNALIIGGVVAAAVGVGAFIHSQQKQSFVERENARRQENANKRGL